MEHSTTEKKGNTKTRYGSVKPFKSVIASANLYREAKTLEVELKNPLNFADSILHPVEKTLEMIDNFKTAYQTPLWDLDMWSDPQAKINEVSAPLIRQFFKNLPSLVDSKFVELNGMRSSLKKAINLDRKDFMQLAAFTNENNSLRTEIGEFIIQFMMTTNCPFTGLPFSGDSKVNWITSFRICINRLFGHDHTHNHKEMPRITYQSSDFSWVMYNHDKRKVKKYGEDVLGENYDRFKYFQALEKISYNYDQMQNSFERLTGKKLREFIDADSEISKDSWNIH